MIRRVGESPHQSCLILTSRETPPEISTLQGVTLPVRGLISGLNPPEAASVLRSKAIVTFSDAELRSSRRLLRR